MTTSAFLDDTTQSVFKPVEIECIVCAREEPTHKNFISANKCEALDFARFAPQTSVAIHGLIAARTIGLPHHSLARHHYRRAARGINKIPHSRACARRVRSDLHLIDARGSIPDPKLLDDKSKVHFNANVQR